MQLVVFLPLTGVKFPANSGVVNGYMMETASFDILPTDDFFPGLFTIDVKDFPPLNKVYED